MQPQRLDRIATHARLALAGAALAALLAGIGAAAPPASAAGPCRTSDGLDPDRDGLTCNEEAVRYGTDPLAYDTDFDGLGDGDELFVYGANPLAYDTDGDGAGDGQEVAYGTDPLWADVVVIDDPSDPGNGDSDADGLWNAEELGIYGTDVYNWDTDGDSWGDGAEVGSGSNPLDRFCDPTGCG